MRSHVVFVIFSTKSDFKKFSAGVQCEVTANWATAQAATAVLTRVQLNEDSAARGRRNLHGGKETEVNGEGKDCVGATT